MAGFEREYYEGQIVVTSEQEGGCDKVWLKVAKYLQQLSEQRYMFEVYEEEKGIVIINYGFSHNNKFGAPELHWLDYDECELIENYRNNKEKEK